MPKNLKKTENNTIILEDIEQSYNNDTQKDLFCYYFLKEKEYLLSKYKDFCVWEVYLYFLENKGLPIFFKSNKQILEDLHHCMSEHKLIESKQKLVDENILIVTQSINGKPKSYKFVRLGISIEIQPNKK